MFGDTIAAVSTPRGKGGVALLRVSGAEAISISEKIFIPANGKNLSECKSRTAVFGKILAPDSDGILKEIDTGLATVFVAPSSFTGEDTVEICCHGGILLTETVLSALFFAGARPATAGEFTRRAFLNGKMGLASAEALGNLLEACNREQLTLAHSGMSGKTDTKCREIYQQLKKVLSSVYAVIDYPDEDLAQMSREEMTDAMLKIQKELQKLVATYRTGHAVAEGIKTVICGKPNVGKSSLYNQILGTDAAIVTDVEGTTRDVLQDTAALGKVTLRLFDTAGLHQTEDQVEKIGIERAERALEEAELLLVLFDSTRPVSEEDFALAERLKNANGSVVAVWNKVDLGEKNPPEKLKNYFREWVFISAKSGNGMQSLTETVERLFTDGNLDFRNDAVLSNARQFSAADKALQSVTSAVNAFQIGLPTELCCSDAEEAMSAISELDGRSVSEDLVAEIFSHFCVGK